MAFSNISAILSFWGGFDIKPIAPKSSAIPSTSLKSYDEIKIIGIFDGVFF